MSQVRASHILIKHTGSRNPVSRRTGETITRTPEDAQAQLTEILKTLTPESFPSVAETVSDCSSYRNGGDLGSFGRGQMVPSFEEATYSLKVCWFHTIFHAATSSLPESFLLYDDYFILYNSLLFGSILLLIRFGPSIFHHPNSIGTQNINQL